MYSQVLPLKESSFYLCLQFSGFSRVSWLFRRSIILLSSLPVTLGLSPVRSLSKVSSFLFFSAGWSLNLSRFSGCLAIAISNLYSLLSLLIPLERRSQRWQFPSSSPSKRGSCTLCFSCVLRKATIVSCLLVAHYNSRLHMAVPTVFPHALDTDCPLGLITSSLLIVTITTHCISGRLCWPRYFLEFHGLKFFFLWKEHQYLQGKTFLQSCTDIWKK